MDANDRKENVEENLNKVDNPGSSGQQESQSNLKVAIYARVSTDAQSTETQLLPLREFVKKMGFMDVVEYIDPGYSGKDDRRPAFQELLKDMRENKIKCIVVYKLDRIGRSLQHLLALLDEFRRKKVEFISITQNLNTTTAEGKLLLQLLCVFADYERQLIISRTLAGLERARKEGKVLGRPKGRADKKPRRTSGYVERWKNWREKNSKSSLTPHAE